jgi:hypothetical protein
MKTASRLSSADLGSVNVRGRGGELTGTPIDRADRSNGYHMLADVTGLSLNAAVPGANSQDIELVESIRDLMPATRRGGHRRTRRGPEGP